jgi:hypothetical protein
MGSALELIQRTGARFCGSAGPSNRDQGSEMRAARREWLVLAGPSEERALARRPASHQEMTSGTISSRQPGANSSPPRNETGDLRGRRFHPKSEAERGRSNAARDNGKDCSRIAYSTDLVGANTAPVRSSSTASPSA